MCYLVKSHTLPGLDFPKLISYMIFNLKFDYEVVSLDPSTNIQYIFAYVRTEESIEIAIQLPRPT